MIFFRRLFVTHADADDTSKALPIDIQSLAQSDTTLSGTSEDTAGHTVVRTHRGRILLRYWIHLLAILATGALAALNFLDVYLMDSDDPNAIAKVGAFQFVAKLHEAIMLGSLSLAMIDFTRNALLSASGIPLGYVLSPVMYSNIDWLLSASFWTNRPTNRQFVSHAIAKRSSLRPFLIIVIAIVFANVAGPTSAIMIVPRLGWSDAGPAALFPSFWNASAEAFWPNQLTATSLPPKCSEGGAVGTKGCPALGAKAVAILWDSQTGPGVLCTTERFRSSCNASMSSSTAASAILRTLSVDFDLDSLRAYVATPNAAIFGTLGSRFQSGVAHPFNISDTRTIQAGKTELVDVKFADPEGMFKPAVATSCRELQYNQVVQLYQEKNISTNWSIPTVTWLADAEELDQDSFLFSYRTDSREFDDASECEGEECYAALVCGIAPRWSKHGLWYNTAQTSLLFQDNPQPRDIFNGKGLSNRPVVLKKEWMEMTSVDGGTDLAQNIVSLLNDWNTPRVRAPQAVQGSVQENIGPTNYSVAIGIILGGTLVEAMANGPAAVGESLYNGDCNDTNPGFSFSEAICAQDPSFWVHARSLAEDVQGDYSMVSFTVRRKGWGW